MAVRLHTCPFMFFKADSHSCHRVRAALDEAGVEYEIVKEPALPRSRRKEVERISGQTRLPVIEFEDGSAYRAESSEMAARIRAGELFSDQAGGSGAAVAGSTAATGTGSPSATGAASAPPAEQGSPDA